MEAQELRQWIDGKPYTVGLLSLRRAGYNFACEFKRGEQWGFAYSKGDDHIKMTLEVDEDVVVKVIQEEIER